MRLTTFLDPATHSLVLRAGGFDTRHGNASLVREGVELRDAGKGGFDAATEQMIEHFDGALRKFESDVHEGKANVTVASDRGGSIGGGGSFDWLTLLALLPFAVISGRYRGQSKGLRWTPREYPAQWMPAHAREAS
jgi:rhombotail lipoprotein